MARFLEAGKIVGTHGVRGEVKITPFVDSAGFLSRIPVLYLSGSPKRVLSARVHKGFVLAKLEGVDSVDAAMAVKGSVLHFDRADVPLEEGAFFIADILGWPVFDGRLGRLIGTLANVLNLPASDVYVVSGETGDVLIPAVPQFVERVDFNDKTLYVRTIPGMGDEA